MKIVGKRLPRVDGVAKVTGRARFVDDLHPAGMLYGAVVRSDQPHARLLNVDPADALVDPDVVCVLTAGDIPGQNVVKIIFEDQPLLAASIVRYVGEPIALVAAKTRRAARKAVKKVRVEYEPLEPLLDLTRARSNPIQIFGEDNVFARHLTRRGDPDGAFARAAAVVEEIYRTPAQEHAYIETQGMLAIPHPDGGLEMFGAMQCPFYVQLALAQVLGLDYSRVRVVQTVTGGAFGGKEDVPSLVAGQAGLLAVATGRPVKVVYEREEDIIATSKRHPGWIRYRSAAAEDGTLLAVDVEYILDGGAYATISPVVLWRGTVQSVGPYRCENVKVDSYAVATNKPPCGAFRGFGSPQITFAAESQMDKLAHALGLHPVQIRLRNLLKPGDETSTGQRLEHSVGAIPALEAALSKAEWNAETGTFPTVSAGEHKKTGYGISTIHYGVGLGAGGKKMARCGAFVQVMADGSAQVAVGVTEMGQGMRTVLAQIAAQALGVAFEQVNVLETDTSRVPDSGPTVASRSTVMGGNAVRIAAEPLRRRLTAQAALLLETDPDQVVLEAGVARGPDGRELPLAQIARSCIEARLPMAEQGLAVAPPTSWDEETGQGDAYFTFAFAANIAIVEVDELTGEVKLLRYISAHDIGKAINPTLVEGQIEGGSLQGIGYALTERIISEGGHTLNPQFANYIIPTAVDAPAIDPLIVEEPFPDGPHGAKGFGEQPLIGAAPAIVNAIRDAVGVRITELPALPERVLAQMKRKNG